MTPGVFIFPAAQRRADTHARRLLSEFIIKQAAECNRESVLNVSQFRTAYCRQGESRKKKREREYIGMFAAMVWRSAQIEIVVFEEISCDLAGSQLRFSRSEWPGNF